MLENTESHKRVTVTNGLEKERKVIGSSEQVHVVDALAITGEEGRVGLRKALGSWQKSIDPEISEWGNPALHRTLSGSGDR